MIPQTVTLSETFLTQLVALQVKLCYNLTNVMDGGYVMKKSVICLIVGIVTLTIASYLGIQGYNNYVYSKEKDSWIADGMKSIEYNTELLELTFRYLELSLAIEYNEIDGTPAEYDTSTEQQIRNDLYYDCMIQKFHSNMDSYVLYVYEWMWREELIYEIDNLSQTNISIMEHAIHNYAEIDPKDAKSTQLIKAYDNYNSYKVEYAQSYADSLINHMNGTIEDRPLIEELILICANLSQEEFATIESASDYESFFCDYIEYFCGKEKKSFVSSLVTESVFLSDNCLTACRVALDK